ncbi:MAG: hypothetical protein ACYDER_10180 [Ktedonobacteraceae bacterium]
MQQKLSDIITLKRRYSRSINLERDLSVIDSVLGYIPTAWTLEVTERILMAFSTSYSVRAWTITGVYGTGKSAFAHFLASLVAPKNDPISTNARNVLEQYIGSDHPLMLKLSSVIPASGIIRAVATAQREPLSYTIVRALRRGCELFWESDYDHSQVYPILERLQTNIQENQRISNQEILDCLTQISLEADTGILLMIDELGKSLEYTAWHQESDDLYLLQQLAEFPVNEQAPKVFIIGLLHQAFAEYAQNVTKLQRNEWSKVQGRFEDIPFVSTNEHMLHLMSQAIDHAQAQDLEALLYHWATTWQRTLSAHGIDQGQLPLQSFTHLYPLHPMAALTLPLLCNRYAQNDRSLFTFLSSHEPYSFATFLHETAVQSEYPSTLRLHRVYDYFIEASNIVSASKVSPQRWIEVQNRIVDAVHLEADLVATLKTIGLLNLVSSVGMLRATRQLVIYALVENPLDEQEAQRWDSAIQELVKRGLVTYRKQLDELRIWEGSDFDVEQAIVTTMEAEQSTVAAILNRTEPLNPCIAQRHSYQTGALRYFERYYVDSDKDLMTLKVSNPESVGVIGYWLNNNLPEKCPAYTVDEKPLILLYGTNVDRIDAMSREYASLTIIETSAPQLQSDGVARREVRQRLIQIKHFLNDLLAQSFLSGNQELLCCFCGKILHIGTQKDFQQHLSEVCDTLYPQTPILWNELINRKEITSQGAKARRELIEAMLNSEHEERLGLSGNGPEVSIYMSLLNRTGIHRYTQDQWCFTEPHEQTILNVWQAIEDFCLNARTQTESLDLLYTKLESPPYGMKKGPIPVLLAAVLLKHADDISIYQDGTFIPLLRADHFELLVKQPARFAVKHFEIVGLRLQVFKELALTLRSSRASSASSSLRNNTVLSIVRPLIQFGGNLPTYTVKTKQLSREARAVRDALRDAREPDELLFTTLPQACGLASIGIFDEQNDIALQQFKKVLVQAIQELQSAYDSLVDNCKHLVYNTFAVRSDITKIREDLRVRAQYLKEHCIERQMKSFIIAAISDMTNEREWLEALLMVIADKPAISWVDEDTARFEVRLSDLARRFVHLEAIQREAYQSIPSGFDVQRITITNPDGFEDNHVVWLNQEHQSLISAFADKILSNESVRGDEQLQQELVAELVKRVFHSEQEQSIRHLSAHGKEV